MISPGGEGAGQGRPAHNFMAAAGSTRVALPTPEGRRPTGWRPVPQGTIVAQFPYPREGGRGEGRAGQARGSQTVMGPGARLSQRQ